MANGGRENINGTKIGISKAEAFLQRFAKSLSICRPGSSVTMGFLGPSYDNQGVLLCASHL